MSIVYVRVRSKPIRHEKQVVPRAGNRRLLRRCPPQRTGPVWVPDNGAERPYSILTGKADRNDRSNWRSTIRSARMNAHLLSGTRLAALERDQKDRLAAELAVAKQRIADQRGIITWASTQSPVVLPLRFFNGKVISARDTSAHKATGLGFPVLVDVRSKPVSSAVVLR